MTEESILVLRGEKCADIIKAISELYGVTLIEATDIFYESKISELIEEGIADLHCRSSKYLATLVWEEFCRNHKS